MTGDLIDQVRYKILQFFNTDATEYSVVFNANATAALKLVAETFDFGDKGNFYYCQQNHTSVLGMREVVGTERQFVLTTTELLKNSSVDGKLQCKKQLPENEQKTSNSLLVFPAQCNFSGYKMPLNIISNIHKNGLIGHGKHTCGGIDEVECVDSEFYVCLDAAAFVATSFLDLQHYKPDFCCISFYKIFGYPTGVGALLVSKRGQTALKKRFYGGGTVDIAMSRDNFHAKRANFISCFEDGTLSFLSIAALLEGFRTIDRLIPATRTKRSIERISAHVYTLAKYCHDQLTLLRHGNGMPFVKIYTQAGYDQQHLQGGIVTFNLLHADGSYIGFAEVVCIAAVHNIQLRTGCFCNPGACQSFLQISDQTVRANYAAGHICSDYNDLIDGLPTGAVRLSFGYMTTIEDISRLLEMLRNSFLEFTTMQRLKLLENANVPDQLQTVVTQRLKPQLKQICVYPVKSCGSFIVKSWPLTSYGLKYDRNWLIVDANGVAITQKQHPRLCLISPHIDLELGVLELSFPGYAKISLSLESDDNAKSVSSSLCCSKVCNHLIQGINCGDAVANWLCNCLDVEGLSLLQQTSERRNLDGTTKYISFVNQAQFLLINRSSVRWLAAKITDQEPLDHVIARFRANFIVETATPLEENNFDQIDIGGIKFKMDSFCKRCQMICIDQQSGQHTAEPLRTIARELNGKIRFGIYLSLTDTIEHETLLSCDHKLEIKLKEQ